MSADNPFSERRVMTLIAALALIIAVAGKAHAQKETFVARGAVLCALSSNLREADKAARLRDQAWLKRLDCFEVQADMPVTLIDRGDFALQAKIRPKTGEGIVVWGLAEFFSTHPTTQARSAAPKKGDGPQKTAEDPMFSFSELRQTIVRSGHKCERVRGVLTIRAIHTVTCLNGTASFVYYDLTARTRATTVLRVERRRN